MAAAFTLAGIAPGAAQTAHLRVVTTPSDSGAEAYEAQELGFFRKALIQPLIDAAARDGVIRAAFPARELIAAP